MNNKVFKALFFLCLTLISWSSVKSVDLITPSGLNPGDSFRFVFISTTQTTGVSSNISDYDSIISNDATGYKYNNLGINWKAIVSTQTIDAKDHIGGNNLNTPIYVVTGTKIADNLTSGTGGLWSGFVQGYITIRIDGSSYFNWTWTGTDYQGLKQYPVGGSPVTYGNPLSASGTWINSGNNTVGSNFNLYGISDSLTVPVPEPSTYASTTISLVALLFTYYFKVSGSQ